MRSFNITPMLTTPEQDAINAAIATLSAGELVAIPTETVYGLAANAFDSKAVERIFQLKGRPSNNPLIVHIGKIEDLDSVTSQVPETARKLAEKFWPGPLTLILPKSARIPSNVSAGLNTVGVRMPNHPLTLQLLRQLPFPLAAPSANPSGRVSPSTAQHVMSYFNYSGLQVLDGGACQQGIESTIVGFDEAHIHVYRLGTINPEDLAEACEMPVLLQLQNDARPLAPGMLTRHYSPQTRTLLTRDLPADIEKYKHLKVAVLAFTSFIIDPEKAVEHIVLTNTGDYAEAASNLYAALHRLDQSGANLILCELLPEEGIASAINDRLRRAAAQ
jgi:L-threonylcarbamoyladenylate synthase